MQDSTQMTDMSTEFAGGGGASIVNPLMKRICTKRRGFI
jgi:hypothetical protein